MAKKYVFFPAFYELNEYLVKKWCKNAKLSILRPCFVKLLGTLLGHFNQTDKRMFLNINILKTDKINKCCLTILTRQRNLTFCSSLGSVYMTNSISSPTLVKLSSWSTFYPSPNLYYNRACYFSATVGGE